MSLCRRHASALVLAAAIGGYSFGGPDGNGRPPRGRPPMGAPPDSARARMMHKPLTAEQKAYLDVERALRDSMAGAVRAYAESVSKGSDARSMVTDRAVINDFARRLERFRQENLDTWLDVLAVRPFPGPGRHPRHAQRGDDSLPPPPECDSIPENR